MVDGNLVVVVDCTLVGGKMVWCCCWITAERCMIDSTGRWLKGRYRVGVCVSNFKDTDFTLVVAPRLEHIW